MTTLLLRHGDCGEEKERERERGHNAGTKAIVSIFARSSSVLCSWRICSDDEQWNCIIGAIFRKGFHKGSNVIVHCPARYFRLVALR